MKKAIIVFQKNKIPGKVKTRLAKSIGDVAALEWYGQMIDYTYSVINALNETVFIYYSDFMEYEAPKEFQLRTQKGNDLGEKMLHAFEEVKREGFDKIVIIGTDCLEITSDIISHAFLALETNDFVIGPAKDGGYYLLGMNEIQNNIFENKSWSTNTVLESTKNDLIKLNKKVHFLETLNDIDDLEDLQEYQFKQGNI